MGRNPYNFWFIFWENDNFINSFWNLLTFTTPLHCLVNHIDKLNTSPVRICQHEVIFFGSSLTNCGAEVNGIYLSDIFSLCFQKQMKKIHCQGLELQFAFFAFVLIWPETWQIVILFFSYLPTLNSLINEHARLLSFFGNLCHQTFNFSCNKLEKFTPYFFFFFM